MTLQAVILAAGKGTRLMPFTRHCSKGMAPILGQPIARRVIEQFIPHGIRDFILVIHPQDEMIRPYFESYASQYDLRFSFAVQTEQKGMAHALLQAAPLLRHDFFLSACDNLVHHSVVPEMMDALSNGVSSVLLCKPVTPDQVSSTGIIEYDGDRIVRIHEKPRPEEATSNISSLPMYLLRRDICEYLPRIQPSNRGEYELQDAMEMMLSTGEMKGIMTDWRLTLTHVEDLYAINLHFLHHEQPAWISPTAQVHPDVELVPPYHIGSQVIVESGVHLGPNVYLDESVQIGRQAILQNAVILQQAHMPAGASVIGEIRY